MEQQYTITHDLVKEVPVIYIEGDMTSETEDAVLKSYAELKNGSALHRLVFEFTKTNYINSAGIATLITVIEEMGKDSGKVSFVGLSNHFLKVMDIVGLSDFVDIHETLDEALRQ